MAGKFQLADHIQKSQPPQVRDIEVITEEIITAKLQIGENLFVIGRGLIEAKAQLSHGEWLSWLAMRVEFSEATAQNYMKLVRKYSNPEALRDLGYTKALMLLALPDGTREEYIESTHVVNGEEKTVADMSTRELKAALKERDEALKAAEQAKADQSAAEQAREKISQDMKLANERVEGLNAELRDRQKTLDLLTAELKQLKERPVEVAVEPDPAAVEAARKETEERMQGRLDDTKKAYDKARADLMEANSALQRAKLEREQVEIGLRKQLEAAEKKAALAANEDFVLFKTIFERIQEDGNKLVGLVMKARNKDQELSEGFSRAFLTWLDKKREEVGR